MRSRLLATALTLSASCYRPAPRDTALEARVATLEARVAEQDRQLAAARSSEQGAIEMSALASKIEALTTKIAELSTSIPAPRPKRRTPDASLTYAVPVGTSPFEGPSSARVTLVMAFDFACPYCRKAWDTVTTLQKKYGADLRVVFKQYVVHPQVAQYPAQAACAAGRQGKFRALAQLLWTKAFDARAFEDEHIDQLAKQAKLDMKRYRSDVTSCEAEVRDDGLLMKKLAVNATPTFFINGHFVEGAKDASTFETMIYAELARADAAIAAGTPADKIYEIEVLGKGLTEVPAP